VRSADLIKMLYDASVTNSLVNFATSVVRHGGLAGVAGLTVSSAVIGAPGTELTMLFAGFNVYDHHLTLLGIMVFGVIGDIVGATIAYAIGYFGLYELLDRKSGPLHVGPSGLGRAHAWFERYGLPVLFGSRLIPLLRSAFPYAAGVAKVPYLRFAALTLAGSIVWICGLALIGRAVGSEWSSWRAHLEYVDYAVIVLFVGLIGWFVIRRIRGERERQAHA
jgi:membrane protein DedA with SNARE-associated domain